MNLFPISVSLNQVNQSFDRLRLRNEFLHASLSLVKVHLALRRTDLTIVGIRHLTRTIHDAAHDTDLQAFQMGGLLLDPCDGGL